ncbi:hypothetical protein XELAEV_18037084mg [Xenopus laevis]|uniref:Lipoxygenase domain-containing protein n=1 Tax=Xenopus laevis TaxID=8355 RepID=A0A974CBK9_XENLA|nr:hypothetical protein XELAEV_18037084mg [Xenopus laevis]
MENLFVNSFMHMFQSSWNDFADFEKIFVRISNTISEYVMQHWKEDFMFGYQFLNGCNPVMITKCKKIPANFPVTNEMVECSLERNLTLEQEIELLIHHVRFTIAINTKAREQLICECGLFDKANATGGGGHVELLLRAMKYFTYESLCLPEAIQMRGMENTEEIPYYFYRDDGLKVWEATQKIRIRFGWAESRILLKKAESWIRCIPTLNPQQRFPKVIKTKDKLIEYLTLVIFTASGQHAAVNFGQYDWCSWIPNSPPTMRQPPPTEKGVVTIEFIIESLPDRGRSCWHLGAVWALSQFQDNEIFLGYYPDEHFVEKSVKEAMVKFRKNLEEITSFIQDRNKNKKLPYYYVSPDRIPNSVAV